MGVGDRRGAGKVTITRRLAAILVSGIAALVFPAHAHQGGTTGIASIAIGDNSIRYSLTLPDVPMPSPLSEQMGFGQPGVTPDYQRLARAIAEKIHFTNDGADCVAAPGQIVPPSATAVIVTTIVDFVCPGKIGDLRIRDDLFDLAGPNLHTLARIEWAGGIQQFVFAAEARVTMVSVGAKSAAALSAGGSFTLGVAHILNGYDHLLFLLVLTLRGGGLLALLRIITAFTVAHSITLALAAFDMAVVPGRLVEIVIPLTIAWVAAENLFPQYALSRRWFASAVFGLVHGSGFLPVLASIGAPGENLALPLLTVNLGIEVGQTIVVLLIVPILIRLRDRKWEPRLVATLSAGVLAAGLFLLAERALSGA
jgi:hypothetical protein